MPESQAEKLRAMERLFKMILTAVLRAGEVEEADLEKLVFPRPNPNASAMAKREAIEMMLDLARNMAHPDEGYLVREGTRYRIGPSVTVRRRDGVDTLESVLAGGGRMVAGSREESHTVSYEDVLRERAKEHPITPDNGRGRPPRKTT